MGLGPGRAAAGRSRSGARSPGSSSAQPPAARQVHAERGRGAHRPVERLRLAGRAASSTTSGRESGAADQPALEQLAAAGHRRPVDARGGAALRGRGAGRRPRARAAAAPSRSASLAELVPPRAARRAPLAPQRCDRLDPRQDQDLAATAPVDLARPQPERVADDRAARLEPPPAAAVRAPELQLDARRRGPTGSGLAAAGRRARRRAAAAAPAADPDPQRIGLVPRPPAGPRLALEPRPARRQPHPGAGAGREQDAGRPRALAATAGRSRARPATSAAASGRA